MIANIYIDVDCMFLLKYFKYVIIVHIRLSQVKFVVKFYLKIFYCKDIILRLSHHNSLMFFW